jgi:hypothetical protein
MRSQVQFSTTIGDRGLELSYPVAIDQGEWQSSKAIYIVSGVVPMSAQRYGTRSFTDRT